MKKTLLITLMLGTMAGAGFVTYFSWKAPVQTSESFFESGKSYYDAGKFQEATIQFLNALQKNPRHRDARYFLALGYMKQQEWARAVRELKALLEYHPNDVPANLELGNLYLAGGPSDSKFFRQATEIADKILAEDPNNIRALILSGNAAAGLRDFPSSVEILQKALSLDPDNVAATLNLGTFQAYQRAYPEAEKALLKARELDPKHKGVLVSLANYYRVTGNDQKAEDFLKEALSIYPTDKEIYLQLVRFYFQLERPDSAEKVLREVQEKMPDNPEPLLVLVDLKSSLNQRADADRLLLDLKGRFPQNLAVAKRVAVGLMKSDRGRAQKEIEQILKENPKDPEGHALLGELQFFSGEIDAAEATFSKDFVLNSSIPEPHYFLGAIAERKGQLDQAQERYQKALDINNRHLASRAALAGIFLKKGMLADARAELKKALESQPSYIPARLMNATLHTVERNYTEAEREFSALVKEQPDNSVIHQRMGLFLQERGSASEAEKHLVRALELEPESEETLKFLVEFYIGQKQTDKAAAKINSVPENKKTAFHFELMGQAYSKSGKFQEAERAYTKAIEREPHRATSYVHLAADYFQRGRNEEGLKKIDELLKKNPYEAGAYGIKGYIYQVQGKQEEAIKNYKEALKLNPNLPSAANNLAYLMAEQGRDLEVALKWAQTARKLDPYNPDNADTLGWIYYKFGNYVLAQNQLVFAASRKSNDPVIQYHLGMAYWKTKKGDEAKNALRKSLSLKREFKEKPLAEAALQEITKESS
jgi:tetratricopeptide (TPR) repeat protein